MKIIATLIRTVILAAFLFLLSIQIASAQSASGNGFSFIKTKAIVVNDITYIKFLITESNEEVIYVVQRSFDGENYSDIFMKKGVKSPNKIPLLYCCKDFQAPTNATVFYRVKRVVKDDVVYSQVFENKPLNIEQTPVMAQDEPEIK